ncbi:MAG: phosphate ABC transporter permease subunit PstC [Chitinispirillaceae bacterium]
MNRVESGNKTGVENTHCGKSPQVSPPENKPSENHIPNSSVQYGDLRKKTFRPIEFIIERTIHFVAFFSLAFIVLIFTFIFREAFSIFTPQESEITMDESVETYGAESLGDEEEGADYAEADELDQESASSFTDIFDKEWVPVSLNPRYGIWPLLVGSMKVAFIAILISAPIAILAALYTSTFAGSRVREIVKPAVEILAGFPSVVIGFFALIVLASLVQSIFGLEYRLNAFVGGLALSIAIIPIIFTISEDALNSVPRSFTEASLALGAEKWETALFVVLPAAMPGIFAAVLLGVGRAIGETMIVLMATGNAAFASLNPFEPIRTMSATIGAEMAEVVFGDFHYSVLFFIGTVLFAISFIINFTAETVVRRLVMRRFK